MRRVNIWIIIYLDDMLLTGRILPEIFMVRYTLIFLLQHFGFVINLKKSVLHPVKQIKLLDFVIDKEKMNFALSDEKLKHVSQQCQEIFKQPKTSVLNLTKLIGLLSSTVQTIWSARIQLWYLQQEKILGLKKKESYSGHVTLSNLAREELLWWMENFKLCNRREIQQREPNMIIQTDASTKGLGHTAREFRQGGNSQRSRSILISVFYHYWH